MGACYEFGVLAIRCEIRMNGAVRDQMERDEMGLDEYYAYLNFPRTMRDGSSILETRELR